MSVICFASLKGGVGKTSLSVNVSHAFAERDCQVLLIDLDPTGHATRLFAKTTANYESTLARLFLAQESLNVDTDAVVEPNPGVITPCRKQFDVIPAGPELRHFLWGKGARCFASLFAELVEELKDTYDHIIIDTPPDFNVLTRNAIAVSDLVVVPIDSSEMSIFCLEELVSNASHIQGPSWAIVRSMVSRGAKRVQQLATNRLEANLSLSDARSLEDDDSFEEEAAAEDISGLFDVLRDQEVKGHGISASTIPDEQPQESPIYLLNAIVYRTELQNRLTFLGRTAFDTKETAKLAEQYLAVARELEQSLSLIAESKNPSGLEPERDPEERDEDEDLDRDSLLDFAQVSNSY